MDKGLDRLQMVAVDLAEGKHLEILPGGSDILTGSREWVRCYCAEMAEKDVLDKAMNRRPKGRRVLGGTKGDLCLASREPKYSYEYKREEGIFNGDENGMSMFTLQVLF